MNTGRGAHLLLEANWPDSFSVVWGSLHLLHNEPVTFPALPVPIYTPGWRGVVTVKCLTQGHNTLTVTGLESTTFCLWIQHWSARPHAPTYYPLWNEALMSLSSLRGYCQSCILGIPVLFGNIPLFDITFLGNGHTWVQIPGCAVCIGIPNLL